MFTRIQSNLVSFHQASVNFSLGQFSINFSQHESILVKVGRNSTQETSDDNSKQTTVEVSQKQASVRGFTSNPKSHQPYFTLVEDPKTSTGQKHDTHFLMNTPPREHCHHYLSNFIPTTNRTDQNTGKWCLFFSLNVWAIRPSATILGSLPSCVPIFQNPKTPKLSQLAKIETRKDPKSSAGTWTSFLILTDPRVEWSRGRICGSI